MARLSSKERQALEALEREEKRLKFLSEMRENPYTGELVIRGIATVKSMLDPVYWVEYDKEENSIKGYLDRKGEYIPLSGLEDAAELNRLPYQPRSGVPLSVGEGEVSFGGLSPICIGETEVTYEWLLQNHGRDSRKWERPYSALTGGHTYSVLEEEFRQLLVFIYGVEMIPYGKLPDELRQEIDSLAKKAGGQKSASESDDPLWDSPLFGGD